MILSRTITVLTTLVGLTCCMAIIAGMYPAGIGGFACLLLACGAISAPIIIVGCIAALIMLIRRHNALSSMGPIAFPVKRAILMALMLAGTYGLLINGIPIRYAFSCARPGFESLLAAAPKPAFGAAKLNHSIGIYAVDEYAEDPQGGVYFRTNSAPDGIGPDTLSSGFCYKPNPRQTPFGKSSYQLHHIADDWFWFTVSND